MSREERPSSTLESTPSTLSVRPFSFHLVVNPRLPIPSLQLFTSNDSDKHTVDRPFAAYNCPPTDMVTIQPHSNILYNCWVDGVEVGLLFGRGGKCTVYYL